MQNFSSIGPVHFKKEREKRIWFLRPILVKIIVLTVSLLVYYTSLIPYIPHISEAFQKENLSEVNNDFIAYEYIVCILAKRRPSITWGVVYSALHSLPYCSSITYILHSKYYRQIKKTYPHSTEYCRNMLEIFIIFHRNWNILVNHSKIFHCNITILTFWNIFLNE